MATITSTGTGDWNAGGTWVGGAVPHDTNDDAVIASGHTVTLTAHDQCKSCVINSGGTFNLGGAGGYQLTCNGENGSNFAFQNNGTYNHGNGVLKIENDGSGLNAVEGTPHYNLQFAGAGQIYGTTTIANDLSITAGRTVTLVGGATTVSGDLNIPIGTLTTGSDIALTVTGAASVTGTLTGNASAISLGSLTIADGGTYNATSGTTTLTANSGTSGSAIYRHSGGTFTHSNGKILLNSGSTQYIRSTGATVAVAFYDLELTGSAIKQIRDCDITVANDLTVGTGATLSNEGSANTITVTVDVDVTGTLDTSVGGDHTFGSLTINSGGTYIATSGTTTITSASSNYAITNNGTFTHNKGNVTITGGSNQWLQGSGSGAYYNLTSDNNSSLGMGIGVTGFTILNNLTINASKNLGFVSASHTLTVHGNTFVNGTFGPVTSPTGAHTFHGLVTNTGTFNTTSGTNNFNGGVRNLGTFTSNDTLTIGGTGGILEGNLDDAIINVNLDPVYYFDGTDDKVEVNDHADLDMGTSDFTWSAWIKTASTTSATADQSILDKRKDEGAHWDGPCMMITSAGRLKCELYYGNSTNCLLYTSPSPRDRTRSRMPSSA